MATVKAVVIPQRASRKTGLCKVQLSITHKRKRVYIDTGVECLPELFVNGRLTNKVPNHAKLNMKIANMVADYDERIGKIRAQDSYDVQALVKLADVGDGGVAPSYTYSRWCDMIRERCLKDGRVKYADLLERSKGVLADFLEDRIKSRDIGLQDITPFIVSSWKEWMMGTRGLSVSTAGMYLSEVKAVVNRAVREGIVKYEKHPFANTKIGRSTVRRCDISVEELANLRDTDVLSPGVAKVRDIWMLSFYLCGMNLVDMMSVKFDLQKKVVEYQRKKTRDRNPETIALPLCHEARTIIGKYMNDDGMLDFGYKGKHQTMLRTIDHRLKDIAKKIGISNVICLYSARKTFGQLASEAGVNVEMIDYLLGHSSQSRGVIRHYVHQEYGLCAVAIRKVMDYVADPKKDKDDVEKILKRL